MAGGCRRQVLAAPRAAEVTCWLWQCRRQRRLVLVTAGHSPPRPTRPLICLICYKFETQQENLKKTWNWNYWIFLMEQVLWSPKTGMNMAVLSRRFALFTSFNWTDIWHNFNIEAKRGRITGNSKLHPGKLTENFWRSLFCRISWWMQNLSLWSSGKGQARMGKGWPLRRKASKPKPLPRAYIKVGCHHHHPPASLILLN